MALVSDTFHNKKLKENSINIKTKYIVGNEILERNTDNSVNDEITKGIICKKEYYKNNKLVHEETTFDSRIEYTFISKEEENKEFKCPNCGMSGKVKNFIDGCPYCRTHYNIDYTDKDLGSKYHYDRVLRSNKYRIITGIVDLIICLIISFFYIKGTSRTFNSYDISKVFIYGLIASCIFYYVFYVIDGYIILGPIKRYKDRQNEKQKAFWERTNLDKKTFFNNFNYELRKYYYSKENIIDFDIIDYDEFKDYKKDNNSYVDVTVYLRVITIENGKLNSKYLTEVFTMRKNTQGTLELKKGINYIKCHNCGASIDATKGKCEFCNSEIKYLQEWILEK